MLAGHCLDQRKRGSRRNHALQRKSGGGKQLPELLGGPLSSSDEGDHLDVEELSEMRSRRIVEYGLGE